MKTVVKGLATMAAGLAAFAAAAGTELLQNGDFEAGTQGGSETWGSYSTADGYSNPGWTVSEHGGLAKPNGTWMASGLGVGNWAVFLQSNTGFSSSAYQDVEIPAAGTYRLSFNFTSRPSHAGLALTVKLGDETLDTFTTSATVLMHWQKDVYVPAAGTYRLMFATTTASADRAICVDAVSLRALDDVRTWTGGGSSDSIADAGNWGGTPGEAITFTADDYLVFDKAATVTVPADITVKGLKITGDGVVTLSGAGKINVTGDIYSDASTDMIFNCPVAFSSTYFVVKRGNGRVKFPGGVTATYPENAIRSDFGNANMRTLDGIFTFTEDWTTPAIGEYPWILTSGSTIHGQAFSGSINSSPVLYIEKDAYARFTTINTGAAKGEISVDGMLEATTEILVATAGTIGRDGNIGTVKAPRIAKNAGNQPVYSRVPNYIVGAGGFGTGLKDYTVRFYCDTTITASESFDFLGVFNSDNPSDWGLTIMGRMTLTINVPEGLTVRCGIGISGEVEGRLRKTGKGTLVMSDTFNGQSGFAKNFGSNASLTGSLLVDEGTLKVEASGQLGGGTVLLAEGTRMEVSPGVTISNRIDGNGTLQLANGVTLANNGNPWRVGSVEFATATDAVTVTAPDGATAPLAFLTGVNADDLPRFTCAAGALSVKGGALMLADAAAATDYVWNGGASGAWATAANWLVGGAAAAAAPTSAATIRFENDAPVAVTGADALPVAKIITTSGADVTFECPVQFASTYNVQNAAIAPVFAGGAVATIPDDSLTNANIPSHEFRGNVTFTADWTVPNLPAGNPYVVAPGARLNGKTITAAAYQSVNYHLRVDKDAVATFDTVNVYDKFVFKLNGGRLVATGSLNMWQNDCGQYLESNVGTVEANAIIKNDPGHNNINFYITDMIVGAGGFGMFRRDYNLVFQRNSRLTAKADLTIHQPLTEDGKADGKNGDWGLKLNGYTFTIDTAGHTVTFDSWVASNGSRIVKEGDGEMVMQTWLKQHTGGTILNGGLTTVKASGTLGYCTATVNSGATLRFADAAVGHAYPIVVNAGGTLANTVSVGHTSTLTLAAGAKLKPAQNTFFDVSAGTLVPPGSGTVTVDMTDFTFVTGLAVPVLAGVEAGDAAKFTALVPEGVSGAFSVSSGVLCFTATSGGSSAADLLWNPVGDATWSTTVAAWLNPQNEQVAFSPYANATVATAGTIELPADVEANNVTISADGDVTLNGAGKLGGTGTIVKKGDGVFTFNATGGLDSQTVIVSNGVFKLGEDLSGSALGNMADASPFVVAKGGTLDINYNNATDSSNVDRSSVTRNKKLHIAGDGVDGRGAMVNDNKEGACAIGDMILDEDASVGGSAILDVRGARSEQASHPSASIQGAGKSLTVRNTGGFRVVNAAVDLASIVVAESGVLQIEGNSSTWNIPNGIHLNDSSSLVLYGSTTFPAGLGIMADSGDAKISNPSGTAVLNGPVTVASGASLTHTGGTIQYNGKIGGVLGFTGGTVLLTGSEHLNGVEVNGTLAGGGLVRIRQSGTYTGAKLACQTFSVADVNSTPVNVVFKNSTIDTRDVMVSWGCADKTKAPSGSVSVGEGTVFTTAKLAIGDDGTSTDTSIKVTFSVDGGVFSLTNTDFFITHNGPSADFVVNSGTANVPKATIRLRNNNQALGGYNNARFIQNGGTFNYGGSGFFAKWEDNSEEGQIVLKGGEFNATANWSIPHFISTCFKSGAEGGWTLNQADGTTNTWNTALTGDGDVTLNGAATLVGNKEVQGAVGGRWTVGDGFTAGLEGAASLLGGLDIGEGASVTVDIATGRSAVFTARDFGNRDLAHAESIVGRFNKKLGGTTRGTITHDETLLFKNYAQADRPFGNMNYTAAYAVGQFYVEESKTGTWTFEGRCDDRVALWIDGEQVLLSTGDCNTVSGSKEITTAGWHSFRHVISDNSGGFGPAANHAYHTVGYKDPTMSAYARFNVKNLRMRPAADMGDAANANTVRWSHYKGTSSTVTANTFKNDFAWDFCCITNTLDMLQWKGNNDATYMNGYTVNRYEGWFLVTEENAGKEWTFRSQYDDRAAIWIDGVDSGLTGSSENSPTWSVTLSRGWHKFRIQTADFTGSAGPWNTGKKAVSYQVAGGAETQFSNATLLFSVCPDGYVQGEVSLASNAKLSNNVAGGAAEVYGTVKATGTGATVSGPFKFADAKLAYANVAPNTRDLTGLLAFENATDDMLANLGGIDVDFTSDPTVGTVTVGPAYGLAAEDLAANVPVAVTVNGQPFDKKYKARVNGDNIEIVFHIGSVIFIR